MSVRIARKVLDGAVHIRPGSATFGQHVAVDAHGFQPLTLDCEVLYKVIDVYAPQGEGGLCGTIRR